MTKHEDTKTLKSGTASGGDDRGSEPSREYVPVPRETERVASQVVDSAIRVHRALGPGLLESAYEACLVHELAKRGMQVEQQVVVPIVYDGLEVPSGLRLDLRVGGSVVVEVKAVEKMLPLFEAQLLTYLKLTGCRLGLLVNFNVPLAKDGIKRFVR